eukprot:8301992-Karenia_brevis.AAC.1
MGARILKAVAKNQTFGFMRCQEWSCPGNHPTIGITPDYQTNPERDTTVADLMWSEGLVKATYMLPPLPWEHPAERPMP